MTYKQKTIKKECSISGMGLHTGCDVNITFKPAEVNTGIRFVRVDLEGNPIIPADVHNVEIDTHELRCTSLDRGEVVVYTVEHLMSALFVLGLNNLLIEIDGPEVPGMDGSGRDFIELIKGVGLVEQEEGYDAFKVLEPICVYENSSSLCIYPSDEFKVSYLLDYDNPQMKAQFVELTLNNYDLENDIMPCRTFCLEAEADALRDAGLGKGANYKNTLVVGEKGVKENKVRFPDEFARHKVLDMLGDLYLLGVPLKGHIFAVKSGHSLNIQMLREINKQKEKSEAKLSLHSIGFDDAQKIGIESIMKILPHRYPFLLVDKVFITEKGKKATGIKNVTMNEQFFQGHFPERPVMPGVLMVEAMAQVSGVMILTGREKQDQLAFFMAINDVKFRKIVAPGDQLVMDVEIVKDKRRVAQVKGVAKVDDQVVAEALMTFSLASRFL